MHARTLRRLDQGKPIPFRVLSLGMVVTALLGVRSARCAGKGGALKENLSCACAIS